jgi:hypothetical protein
MSFIDDGWEPDFPRVMHFVDLKNVYKVPSKLLAEYPDYNAAKRNEDFPAAIRLVSEIINKPENIAQLHELKHRYPDAILVPVRAEESGGKNKLPSALAEYIGKKAGFEVDENIVQSNKVHRTGTDEWHRFAFRPEFTGDVQKGRHYILLDDVCAQGGTFSEMRYHIEKNGGQVVQTAALALGGHGDRLAMSPLLKKRIIDKFGDNVLKSFCKEYKIYDGNYKCFTETEGRVIEHSKSLDIAGDRITAARCKGLSRDGEEITQGRSASLTETSRRHTIHR